ncbi:hypothetical protein INT44_008901 [Umbelopsis vinacea]|uniref:Uncharacterized protein n=1 Tax=Umbelopsis vinacea TaxID=44442 RepID=A0A8H7UI32_9FUNG|nr:hypothetical protein INT44_008901 [Umbelopsis vinacea]
MTAYRYIVFVDPAHQSRADRDQCFGLVKSIQSIKVSTKLFSGQVQNTTMKAMPMQSLPKPSHTMNIAALNPMLGRYLQRKVETPLMAKFL